MSQWVVEAGDRDFQTAVIDRSNETPVVVDFWAPWCGPCRTLGPLLERLAQEHQGAFVLAKINIDQNPELSGAVGIQGMPLVMGFGDGQVVSDVVGALPEPAVREFLSKVLPSEADRLAAHASQLLADGDTPAAETAFRRALDLDGRCDRAHIGLARICAARDQLE